MTSFNVINWNPNRKVFEPYNVIPYFIEEYKKLKHKPQTFGEFKTFIESESHYQFWGRCQYEIILTDWPCQKNEEKWDVHKQIMMNIDIITSIVMEECIG